MKILITIEGGIVQDAFADYPGAELIIVDLDLDTTDDEDDIELSPLDGAECVITRRVPGLSPKTIARFDDMGTTEDA